MRNLVKVLLLAAPAVANAAAFDFTTLNGGANNTALPNSVTVSGVIAYGLTFVGGLGSPTPLWLRNQTNDHGLGVCSEGATACSTGGGDVNELSNQANMEGIVLERPAGATWTSLWVSSLDTGGSGGSEEGLLLWSDTQNFDPANSFVFKAGDFAGGAVEGDILTIAAAGGFDATARYVLFINNLNAGTNNDFLVWKGAYRDFLLIPEPATLLLLGAGLAAIGLRRRMAS